MIPVKLTFQAFGPYVKRQEIDFRKFADSGVFLIHGATGSGKTTILDAMTYALYGKSSGGQRGDITAMRCQMAKEDTPTEVEFIFKTGSKTCKFTRSIKERTKRNGDRAFNLSQNAMFLDSDGIFVPFFENPKIRDMEQKANELIGLDYQQFAQVIILPQGKFEKLLMAKSDEKEKILVTLFNAEKWQETAEWICDEANEIARYIALKEEHIHVLFNSEQASSIDDLKIQVEKLKSEIEKSFKEKDEKSELLTTEKEKYQLQKDIFNLFEEKEKTEKELNKIKEKEKSISVLSTKLEKGRKALNVFQKYSSVLNLYKQFRKSTEKLENEKRNNLSCVSALEKAKKALEILKGNEEYIETLKEEKIKLENLTEIYKTISTAAAEAKAEDAALKKLTDENKSKQDICDLTKEDLKKYRKKKDFIFNNYQLNLPILREKYDKFMLMDKKTQELKTISLKINNADSDLCNLNQQLEENKRASALKRDEYEKSYNRYIDETACLLGKNLKEGQKCPVCGSIHHPKKASGTKNAGDTSTIKKLSHELEKLAKEANKIMSLTAKQDAIKTSWIERQENLQEEIVKIKENLKNDTKEDILQKLKYAEKESKKLSSIIETETKLTAKTNRLALELSELNSKILSQSRLREEKSAKLNALNASKIKGIESANDLSAKIGSLKIEIDSYTNKLDSLSERKITAEKLLSSSNASLQFSKEDTKNKSSEYEKGKSEYYVLLQENNFADTAEFKSCLADPNVLDGWNKQIQEYIIEKGAVTRNLKKLIRFTKGKEKPDIDKIKNSITDIEKNITELEKHIALNSDRKERIEKTIQKAEKEQQSLQKMMQKYDLYNSFGVTLRGDRGISLRRYVLGVMLSSVTAEANRLLKNVHDGRYQLCRTLEVSGRTRKAGLELEVFDAYSGEKRSVTGLSGGEKFLVSLALSLGLSAVVQAQSGGIKIGTIFIDEGFGSLDSLSIRDALNVLASIKGSKRLVGIISHVQMLKETIDSSITIEKNRSGSTLIING